MHKSFKLLKIELAKADIEQRYLCELMERSQSYITQRMTGRQPWTMIDQYFLMDLLHIPYDQMHIYFPKTDLRYSKTA